MDRKQTGKINFQRRNVKFVYTNSKGAGIGTKKEYWGKNKEYFAPIKKNNT